MGGCLRSFDEVQRATDLLIVGSGPVGSAIAHGVRSAVPGAQILLVDAGPVLCGQPGRHLANLHRVDTNRRPVFDTGQHSAQPAGAAEQDQVVRARPGMDLVFAGTSDLPAYAQSSNVGGMGVRWTCATPRPDAAERDSWLAGDAWDEALAGAERLLKVSHHPWPRTPVTDGLVDRLRQEYRELGRPVAQMPAAFDPDARPGSAWTGPDVVLGDLLHEPPESFALVPSTLCVELAHKGDRVTGARIAAAGRPGGRLVQTRAVVVAADAVRTPQLLWASGIRPDALGRYVGEHFQLLAAVAWAGRMAGIHDADRTAAMAWVPYCAGHEVQGQVMLFDQQPSGVDPIGGQEQSVAGLSWLIPPTIRPDNRITFGDGATDRTGMPRPQVTYPLVDEDRARIRRAVEDQRRAMRALGDRVLPGGQPRLLPRGSSLHLTGTVRGGAKDDGCSVCAPDGRVWGLENLFVAGNGVISVPTACNPTLTGVALALGTAASVSRLIRAA
jgi:choline dehydrogenase-like flavoprotein